MILLTTLPIPKFSKILPTFYLFKKKLIALFTWLSMINLTNFEIYETAVVSYLKGHFIFIVKKNLLKICGI